MKKLVLLIGLMWGSWIRAEIYVLPKEIKNLTTQVVTKFLVLEKNMVSRHLFLKRKKSLTEAEWEEFLAYEQILYNRKNYIILPLNKVLK